MKKLSPTRLALKILFLVTACLITLTLLVACNSLPTVAPSPAEEPAKPAAEEPAEPTAEKPAEPATSEKLPGAKDFTDTGKPPEGGALIGLPAVGMMTSFRSCYSGNFQQSLQAGIGGKNLVVTLSSSMGFRLPKNLQVKVISIRVLSSFLFQGTFPLIKCPLLSLRSVICYL